MFLLGVQGTVRKGSSDGTLGGCVVLSGMSEEDPGESENGEELESQGRKEKEEMK